jgi:hypothetical protein
MEKEILRLMGLLGAILGAGQIEGNSGVWRPITIVDESNIVAGFNIEIGFYSPSGEYVGSVQTSPDGAGFVNFEIIEERIGGLDSFEFELDRDIDIPFYPLLECRFAIGGKLWYVGELIFKPSTDRRDPVFRYEGNGYAEYLKRIKIDTLYTNKTIEYIAKDLIQTYAVPNSRIIYNADLINPPNITVKKFEVKKKDLWKTFERLLGIANFNYNTEQYTFGVNTDRHFYFEEVSTEVNNAWFEGYQYQDPDTKEDLKKVVNQVNIYRTKEGSQDTELVTTVNDLDSQGKYGLKVKNLTIPVFVDSDSAINIANSILERNANPFSTVKIKNLEAENDPYPIEFYHINNKANVYKIIIAEFELLSEWSFNINNTSINTTEEKVLSGKRSFKCITTTGSAGEYIEKEFEEEKNFPQFLDIWLSQSEQGKFIKIYMWDTDNNLQTEEIEVLIINDFNRSRIEVDLDNIKKVRIEFISDVFNTIYLDRLEVGTNAWFRHNLVLDKIKYRLSRSRLLADAEFGEKVDTLVDKIKKIKRANDDIFDVIEKD